MNVYLIRKLSKSYDATSSELDWTNSIPFSNLIIGATTLSRPGSKIK